MNVRLFFKKIFGKNTDRLPLVNEFNDKYLLDFLTYSSEYNQNVGTTIITGTSIVAGTNNTVDNSAYLFKDLQKKIVVKPIDVLNELETIPTPVTLTLLDDKITILKDKSKLIHQKYAKREITSLIERLENRKKYKEHKAFFDRFQNTTDEKINILLSKYELVMNPSDIFIPEFPDEAISIMKEYSKRVDKICKKKPVFYVIATPDTFKQKNKKRDPILLVQSPFGFYWQILGAWDKEMILLSEL